MSPPALQAILPEPRFPNAVLYTVVDQSQGSAAARYTTVTTSAAQDSDAAEVNTLVDDFANESEAIGYARRMADEMPGLAEQLSLDFHYSNVAIHEGDLIDEELNPTGSFFMAMWVLDEAGVAFVGADEFRENASGEPVQQ